MDNNKWSMSYSWTQPWSQAISWNVNPYTVSVNTDAEIKRLEMVDRWVDSMSSYPDAIEIIEKIKG